MNLQSNGWKRVSVGEVVNELRVTTDSPLENGIEYYIGFEHIESESLQVKQFGNIGDGINFNKTFREGDVLFGKIRAYLKKVAVAPFDGLCSGDILVLRTKDENTLNQKLLPYAITTDGFYKLAIDTSIGTTMPRTKWQYISKHTFPLPPLDEQERIVELFQRIEQSIVQAEKQENNLLVLKSQLLRELVSDRKKFGNFLTAKDFEKVRFEKVALNISERVEPKQTDLEIYVGLEHLDSDDLVIRRKGKPEDVIGTKLKIFKGDIIFGKRRAYLRKVAVADFEGIVSAHSMVLRANEENIEKDFLPYFMQSDEFMNRAVQISEGSLSPTIKWKTLAQQEFILPKREKQAKLIGVFKQFDEARELARQQKEILKKLKQKLLNEILG
jgi:type I restriction enzyme S subunit